MDSVNTDDRVEGLLSMMLEGYESNLQGVDNYIQQTSEQLKNAETQRVEILDNIADLKSILGLEEEASPDLNIVKDE
jgi:hypothetical protein